MKSMNSSKCTENRNKQHNKKIIGVCTSRTERRGKGKNMRDHITLSYRIWMDRYMDSWIDG